MVRSFICKGCNSEFDTSYLKDLNYCSNCLTELTTRTYTKVKKTTTKNVEYYLRNPRNSGINFEDDFFEGTIGIKEEMNTDFGHWGHYY